MFRVICFCKKHAEMNVYFLTDHETAQQIKSDYPGYRAVMYDAS